MIVKPSFFRQDALDVAKQLLGKILYHKVNGIWLSAQIIETEAYYQHDKASHASLGFTPKRKALFMPPGTLYMYYARGGDSLNFSCLGEGNAVLIKSAIVYQDANTAAEMVARMQANNPLAGRKRSLAKLCSGQTLVCRALGLKVASWDQKQLCAKQFQLRYHPQYQVTKIIQAKRLGIPKHRDPHYFYRLIDYNHAHQATQNPLRSRIWQEKLDYKIIHFDAKGC